MGCKAKAWIGVFGFVANVGSCQNALHNDDDLPAKFSALSTTTPSPSAAGPTTAAVAETAVPEPAGEVVTVARVVD